MGPFLYMTLFFIKGILRKWKTLVLLFSVPLVLMGGSAYIAAKAFTDKERLEPFRAAIVDQDQTFQTEYVIKQLTGNEELKKVVKPILTDEESARELLRQNKIAGMAVLPENFSKTIMEGENVPLTVIGNNQQPLQAYLFRQVMESAADYTSAAQSGINTVYDFMLQADVPKEERTKEYKKDVLSFSLHALGRNEIFEEREEDNLFLKNILSYYGISIFVLLLMVWSYQILLYMRGQVTSGIRSRLLLYGMSPWKMILSEWVTASLFLLPFLGAGLFALHSLHVWSGENVLAICAGMMLILLIFTALFSSLAAFFQQDLMFQVISALFISAGCLLGGHFIPSFYLPSWLEPYASYTINTYTLDAASDLFRGRNADFSGLVIFLLAFIITMGLGAAAKEKRLEAKR
ncbi:ABC transporter permease [Bacillus sp. FJAT-42376]|uniref:ABC transporter permease n=1 Tax=Bacillus sp. FJAT-42376 TaxID=2014076 RepID=UPI000F501498|nr:ABC transporter permease [Bacillus sp. FJAT-42376]AZB41011.1 ABC transporter permease [Bacillus sp. FJAT-42376]